MGRPRKTCAALELPTLCEACAQPAKKLRCVIALSDGQQPVAPACSSHQDADVAGGSACNQQAPQWKPAETGRPATTCVRLGLPFKCTACQNPQRKMKCLAVMNEEPNEQGTCLQHQALRPYHPEDWRTEKFALPEVAARKGVQRARTAQIDAMRRACEAQIRKEGFEEAIQMSQLERKELEDMVTTLQEQIKLNSEELKKAQHQRHELMAAKRQRALESWLVHSHDARANMQLPIRKSHFDVQAEASKGYSSSELQRTFRSHVERIEHFIEGMVSDPIKQLQLADAVSRRFGGVKSSMPDDDLAASYVLESLRNFEATLRQRFSGRYPNEIRAAHQAVSAAITSKVPRNRLSVVAEATGMSLESLSDGRRRWASWFDGTEEHMIEFRGQIRSDKMNEAWIEFATNVWVTETRPDPSTKCSIRNPNSRSDKKLYRIHYLDMRIGDMHKLILQRGREHFHDADPPFQFSWWYCIKVSSPPVHYAMYYSHSGHLLTQVRPFFVKPAGRETSVCIYHLRFDLIVEALYTFYKRLRDAKVCCCTFPNVKYPADLRRSLVCPRAEGARFDSNACATAECDLCGELQRFNLCGCIDYDSTTWLIRWEEYKTVPYTRKDGSVSEKQDFVVVNTTFQQFIDHLSAYWRQFAIHHQTAKLQEDDIKWVRNHVERGTVVDVEDFSENGHIKPKREHASRYFSEVSYTLFGMVLTGHLDDFKNIGDREREELREQFDRKRLPHAITESHIAISGDLTHDSAAVQHYNDKLLTPYIKENMVDIQKRIRITDGAPQHFKLAHMALWTSKQQVETGILSENLFGATAHRKDLSDSECGGAKHVVTREQMKSVEGETSRVKDPYEAFLLIREKYGDLTHERFIKKGCTGIYRRFVYWVPACGAGSIDRNIQLCKTLSTKELGGIKSLHELCDIGVPGSLRVRQCSCHSCEACKQGRHAACINMELLGPVETIKLEPETGRSVRLTRNALSEMGVALSREVRHKEIIGIELEGANESFMLGEVLSETGPYTIQVALESYMGQFKPGDVVLDVRKLEPTSAGSSMYELTDKCFPVFVEDIRKRNVEQHLQKVDVSRRSARVAGSASSDAPSQREVFALSPEAKMTLLQLTAAVDQVGDRRSLAQFAR